jgi:ParB family chromosome partitioning protein
MSAKADRLASQFGSNIAQVIGQRPGPTAPQSVPAPDKYDGAIRSRAFGELPVDSVGRDESQPREEFDSTDLERLAASIGQFGQLAPIRVRRDEGRGAWVVLVGERRLRACKLAGLERVRVEFVERPMSEADVLAEQMVENVVRADLRPVEEGRAYRRLIELNSWNVEQLAQTMGVEPTLVHHRLGLLRLPDDVAAKVDAGEIRATAAYEISKLQIADEQREVAALVVSEGLDFKATAAEVARRKSSKPGKGRGGKTKPRRTSATIRTNGGTKITFENRRGVDDAVILAALDEATAAVRGRLERRDEAA